MKNIIVFFGAPGCGKGTQATMLAETCGLTHISTGDELREIASQETPLGKEVASFVNPGRYVPDDIIIEVLKEKVLVCANPEGYIIDGFPRTKQQAVFFDRFLQEVFSSSVPLYITFEVAEEELFRRLANRAVVEGRLDDQDPQTIRKRLDTFKENTVPVIEHYRNKPGFHLLMSTGKRAPQVCEQVKAIFESHQRSF